MGAASPVWAQAASPAPALADSAALFEGFATMAAPDEPLRALSNPAGPALVEGRRWGVALTARNGTGDGGHPVFVHGLGVVEGRDGQGWALWAKHGGREALPGSAARAVTELSLGYTYAMTMGPRSAMGVTGHYRRVRATPGGDEDARDDHYLGVDVGVVSAVTDRVVVAGRLDSLLEVRQVGPGGQAERATARPPALSAGIAYEAHRYLVLEAEARDLLDVSAGRSVRLEARLYPAAPVAIRLGFEQSAPGSGFLLGIGIEAPGRRWALSYAFMGGPAYGGMHQIGLVAAAP